MEEQPKASFTEADVELLLAASQDTLRLLYERAQSLPPDFNSAEGGMLDSTVTDLPGGGGMRSLSVDFHLVPHIDTESGKRHSVTIKLAGILGADEGTDAPSTRTYGIWWANSPKLEGGVYFELRDDDDKLCDEATAKMLLDQLPDPEVHASETRPRSGLQLGVIAQRFGALGILGL